ncbi:hypothetical protein GGR55DRAFT_445232 [Xylaria sp. FL0064]|nr:hypothetical protein GGR55DRAFT_445232 [Xylaria sp. FL0064]
MFSFFKFAVLTFMLELSWCRLFLCVSGIRTAGIGVDFHEAASSASNTKCCCDEHQSRAIKPHFLVTTLASKYNSAQ